MHCPSFSVALLGAAALFSVANAGCKREAPPVPPLIGAPPSAQLNPPVVKPNPSLPAPVAPTGAEALAWELPKGWTEARSGGMRFATLKPPVTGKLDVSVVMLPGPAGGELANVNRWRGQIGLPPVDEATRVQTRQQVDAKAGAVALYDFSSQGPNPQRMLAGLLFASGRSWFVKMVGDEQAVEAARPDFMKLLKSLHFPAAT
jgi:hypothetical protein